MLKTIFWLMIAALPGSASAAAPDLAAAFGAREELEHVSLSPDGARIAYIAPMKGQGAALVTTSLGSGAKPVVALIADGDPERLNWCRWVSNDRLACGIYGALLGDLGVVNFSRIVAVNADGGNLRLLSKSNNLHSRGWNFNGGWIIDWLPEEDGKVLMVRNQLADDRTGSRMGTAKSGLMVDRVDTRTLAASTVEQPKEKADSYLSDGHGNVRIVGMNQLEVGYEKGVVDYSYRLPGRREWQPLSRYDSRTKEGFVPLAIDHERNGVYGVRKKDGRNAIYRISLDGSLTEELIYAHPQVDVDDLVRIGRKRRVVGVSFATDRREVVYFDPAYAKLVSSLGKALPKQPHVRIVEASGDEQKLLILASSDADAGTYYVMDRKTRELALVQSVRPALDGVPLAEMKPVSYAARDGTRIPGYLSLPPGSSGRNLPAIVMPHGGPSARDEWGFDWLVQYFTARGFAVLQPNFRGSTGYGDAWLEKNGFQSWRTAVGDVTDAGKWLVAQGVADPGKLAIFGWSYGGYAALQSAAMEPDLFKAAIAIAPVTDLALLKSQSYGWMNHLVAGKFIGNGPHIQEGSPAQNADRIKAPVLLVHGKLDRNVDIAQSRLMDAKLRGAGRASKLITFDKLDHYLEDSEARTTMLRESYDLLRSALGL